MEKDKKELLDEVSEILNTQYRVDTVGDILYHMPITTKLTSEYNKCILLDFILLCRIDFLYDKGIITQARRDELYELYNDYKNLEDELGKCLGREVSQEESDRRSAPIIESMEKINKVFDNYHLNDEINLSELLSATVKVDNPNMDISGVKGL